MDAGTENASSHDAATPTGTTDSDDRGRRAGMKARSVGPARSAHAIESNTPPRIARRPVSSAAPGGISQACVPSRLVLYAMIPANNSGNTNDP